MLHGLWCQFFGTAWFSAPISGMCVMGIIVVNRYSQKTRSVSTFFRALKARSENTARLNQYVGAYSPITSVV